jgi:ATP-binding cassette, subfamily C, bacterial
MKKIFKVFTSTPGTRPVLVAVSLIIAGLAQAIGIGTFLPIINQLSSARSADSRISELLNQAFSFLGVTPTVGSLILIAVGLLVLKSLISFAALSYVGISAAKVSIDFRQRLITALFGADWRFFASQRSGHIATVVSSDAGRAGDAFLFSGQIVAFLVEGLASCTVAFLIDWRLAAVGICAGATLALVMRRVIRASRRAGYQFTDRTSDLTVFIVDLLANFKPLKTMQRFEPMLGQAQHLLERLRKVVVTRELAKAGLSEGNDALIAIFVGAGIYFATTLADVTLPELVISGVIFIQLVAIASKLQKLMQQFVVVESAYMRTDEMVRRVEESHEFLGRKVAPPQHAAIAFEGISFSHGTYQVIDSASFEIPARAVTVLYGPSGSGKTTLIDLLIGLYQPANGNIAVGGVPLNDIDLSRWRKSIGYVPQELNLFHSSVRDNVTLGDETVSDEAVWSALTKAGAAEFISNLANGIHTSVGELGSKMSGGQRQRISLARALLHEPEILILDEVTSALDPTTELEIVENIRSLGGNYTIIAITHRPAWTRIADRLYEVAGGKVLEATPQSFKGR